MRLQEIAAAFGIFTAVAGLAGWIWAAALDYGPLVTKKDSQATERALSESLLKLAECVDTPKYEQGSDQAIRDPSCQERVLRELREQKSKLAGPDG